MKPEKLFPPQAPDAEKAALGAALQNPDLASELRAGWFHDLRFREIAETIISMATARIPVDTTTVVSALNSIGATNAFALVSECDDACHSPANFPYWRTELENAAMLRAIANTGQSIVSTIEHRNGESAAEILDGYERAVLAIRQSQGSAGDGDPVNVKEALRELTNEYEEAMTNGKPPGLATGYSDLDAILCGLRAQQLIVIAARPSLGKTALALNITERLALDTQIPVGFFSLEMSGKELLHRLACSRARVDGTDLAHGRPSAGDIQRLTVAHADINRAPLFIVDKGGLSIAQLAAYARRQKQRHGIQVLIVDYLGLLRSGEKGRSRYEETTLVSNALKTIAKELNIPVIALCQLNRDNDRDGRTPRLSDLRDSGAIEQDADVVCLLHRDEKESGDDQTICVIVAKQRNGRIGKVDLLFRRQFTRFENAPKICSEDVPQIY